jgi:tetraacyldisaccharide 4'-kinase
MAPNKFISSALLLPLSRLYGLGVGFRNLMFKWGILRQREFDVPVVVVGNIAAGGTGKTPHTEFVVEALRYRYRIGVVSRGYKRRTSGFVMASRRSTPEDIGDEPFQIFQKYGDSVRVAVCEDRCAGIEELLAIDPAINLIVLDDAFQHRYVKPTVAIVLTEFNRPFFMDKLLPLGRLREPVSAINRADMVIVTKCPEQLKPIEYRIFKKKLDLYPCQGLYFSRYSYEALKPLFPDQAPYAPSLSSLTEADTIMALSGIANPKPFAAELSRCCAAVKLTQYPDHHNFTRRDIEAIARRFDELSGDVKLIVTTEKDAVRLSANPYFPHRLKAVTFYLPITVEMDAQSSLSFTDDLVKAIKEGS